MFDVSAKWLASFRRNVQFSITPTHRRLRFRPPFIVNRTLIAHSRFLCLFFFLFLPFWRGALLPSWNANHLQIIKIKKVFFLLIVPFAARNILDFVLTQGSRAPSCFCLALICFVWVVLFAVDATLLVLFSSLFSRSLSLSFNTFDISFIFIRAASRAFSSCSLFCCFIFKMCVFFYFSLLLFLLFLVNVRPGFCAISLLQQTNYNLTCALVSRAQHLASIFVSFFFLP